MIKHIFWLKQLQQTRPRRSVVWLSGLHRVSKTTLAWILPDAVYMNCDLPPTLQALEAPELFLDGQAPGTILIFHEVPHLEDPSRLLKIAANEYPQLKVLMAGSSTLASTHKFRDSFYVRDILELFSICNHQGFLSLFRLLLRQSGGQLDYSQLANLSELSRPTVNIQLELWPS